MKDFLTFMTVGLVLFIFAAWLNHVEPAELPKEYSMKTETGEIVLTQEPCEYIKMGLKGYPYAAYATEKGHANHEGCWKMDVVDRYRAVMIYFPEIDATGVYNPDLFKPRQEPNV
jgi:hypothetical protein